MPKDNGKNTGDTRDMIGTRDAENVRDTRDIRDTENMGDTADKTQNAFLEYIAGLVCDPTEAGDLVKAAREHAAIGQIDIALAWYQKAERLLPHLQSSIVSAREELLQQMMECYPGE